MFITPRQKKRLECHVGFSNLSYCENNQNARVVSGTVYGGFARARVKISSIQSNLATTINFCPKMITIESKLWSLRLTIMSDELHSKIVRLDVVKTVFLCFAMPFSVKLRYTINIV